MKEVVRLEKNRGEPKKKISTKRICKTTPKKELYIDYKGEFPLYNPKHEAFVINLLTMKQGEAYIRAGYNQTRENALKSASKLLSANNEVSQRYEYLQREHNKQLEKKGLISREQMIANAIYAMNCSLGKLPTKVLTKHRIPFFIQDGDEKAKGFHEEIHEELKECHDIKAFPAIWDKLMNALDYYPKDKKNDNGDKLDGFLELLGSAIQNGTK